MPQFSGDPDSFAFDDEVPMIEFDQDELILHDSNGKPTLVVDKNRYHAITNSKGKQTKTRTRRKQHQRHSKNSSKSSEDSSTSTLLQPPPLDPSKSATPSESGTPLQPSTPKIIPPLFQFMGAVASRAKDFFSGPVVDLQPPAGLLNAPSDFPTVAGTYDSTMENKEYLKHRQQNSLSQIPFHPPPPQYQASQNNIPRSHAGVYLNQNIGYMQQPEPPIMPSQGFMDTPMFGLPTMSAMLSTEEPKKSKKHRKHKKSKKGSLDESLLQSKLLPVLMLLTGALFSVMISTYRPVVEGPISGVINKMLTNLQTLASLSMTAGGAMLAYKYLGNSAVVEKTDSAGLGAPQSPPMSSIPAAGTSLGDTPGLPDGFPAYPMMAPQQQLWQNQQHMYQGPSVYDNMLGNIYEKKEMVDQKNYFVPAGAYQSKNHSRNPSTLDSNTLSQKLNALAFGSVQDPLGLYTEDDDEYVDFDEGENNGYYKAMPDTPGPYPAPRTTATTLNMMRPEIIELLRRAQNETKTPSSTNSPAPRATSTGVPTASPAPAPKHRKKTSTDASAAKIKSNQSERIKGVEKKAKDFYVDDYACKPYGPPPKRYRGVNV